MFRLTIFIIIAAVLCLVGIWLANQPGTITINWSLSPVQELPIGLGIAAVAALAIIVLVVFEILRIVWSTPSRYSASRAHNRELRGYQEVSSGLMAVAAGDVSAAKSHSRNAEKLLRNNSANLMLSAQTAQLEGKDDVAQIKFRQMRKEAGAELLGLRGLLAQAIKNGDHDEALELAREAYRRSPTTPWVLTTYFDLLARSGAWKQDLNIVVEMTRQGLIDRETSNKTRAILDHMLAMELHRRGDMESALSAANEAVHLDPGFVPAAVLRSKIAIEVHRPRLAKRAILQCWKTNSHPDLAEAFADLVPDETPRERITRFDILYKLRPNDVTSKIIMAELAMEARDTGLARDFLQKALDIGPTTKVFRLLAEVEKTSGASEHKIEELERRALGARKDPQWVCEDTGETLPSWQPFGPNGRFGTVAWMEPPVVTTMISSGADRAALSHGPEISNAPISNDLPANFGTKTSTRSGPDKSDAGSAAVAT